MRFRDHYRQALRDLEAGKAKPSNERRDLTPDDRAMWYDAGDEREKSIKPRTIEDVRRLLKNRNPVRWGQTQRNIAWVQKEMKKMGLNPEDARYLF